MILATSRALGCLWRTPAASWAMARLGRPLCDAAKVAIWRIVQYRDLLDVTTLGSFGKLPMCSPVHPHRLVERAMMCRYR